MRAVFLVLEIWETYFTVRAAPFPPPGRPRSALGVLTCKEAACVACVSVIAYGGGYISVMVVMHGVNGIESAFICFMRSVMCLTVYSNGGFNG